MLKGVIDPLVLQAKANRVLLKQINNEIEFSTKFEPRVVKTGKNKGDHREKFKNNYNEIIRKNNKTRFIGFKPTNSTHAAFDYYVFDKDDFILHCFQITKEKAIHRKFTKFIEYFTKTTANNPSELDNPFHNKWSDLLKELKDSSQPLEEKIYIVTEKDKVKAYETYFENKNDREKNIEKELKQCSSKKLYNYLLDMNPGFSKILKRVKNLNFDELKEIFSKKFDDEDDEKKRLELLPKLEKEKRKITEAITAFRDEEKRFMRTLTNIKTFGFETLNDFCLTEFKKQINL